jgi:4-amino-4-deoxy-L-arabinose transferase-like glycosyltransferase
MPAAPNQEGPPRSRAALQALAAWALLVATALALRPVLPVDETRYLSIAWEMWVRRDPLVPYLNGVPYSDKGPVLFWLIHAGWRLFGVSAWWPRLVPPLFGLASLFLAARLARRLWPERPEAAAAAPLVLLGFLLWTVYETLLMFDLVLAAFTLLAVDGILTAWWGRALRGWGSAGAAVGLGLLTKGPAALVAPIAVAALAPWWGGRPGPRGGWARWTLGALAGLALAAGMALAWALPAAAAGGEAYGGAILLRQTEQRLVDAAAHPRPWWWYLALLPVLLYPYSLWAPVWRRLRPRRAGPPDLGVRLCLAWALPSLAVFSLVSGKQPHYLLPLLPAAALLVAHGPAEHATEPRWHAVLPAVPLAVVGVALLLAAPLRLAPPGWTSAAAPWAGAGLLLATAVWLAAHLRGPRCRPRLAALSLFLVIALHAAFAGVARRQYDVAPIARHLARLEAEGQPLAYAGNYQGQFHFVGRLRRPFTEIHPPFAAEWLRRHPRGRVIDERPAVPPGLRPEVAQPYRGKLMTVWARGPLPPDLGGGSRTASIRRRP